MTSKARNEMQLQKIQNNYNSVNIEPRRLETINTSRSHELTNQRQHLHETILKMSTILKSATWRQY